MIKNNVFFTVNQNISCRGIVLEDIYDWTSRVYAFFPQKQLRKIL